MIKRCELINSCVEWIDSNDEHRKYGDDILKVVYDDSYIECILKNEDVVFVIDEFGKQCCELKNTSDLYIMCIQKHPRLGLSVVASIRDESGIWKDMNMVFDGNKFSAATKAR